MDRSTQDLTELFLGFQIALSLSGQQLFRLTNWHGYSPAGMEAADFWIIVATTEGVARNAENNFGIGGV